MSKRLSGSSYAGQIPVKKYTLIKDRCIIYTCEQIFLVLLKNWLALQKRTYFSISALYRFEIML